MSKKKVRILLGIGVFIVGIGIPTVSTAGTTSRKANIKSTGNLGFENGSVYIASSDLTYLADEIDHLEDTYKTTTVDALNTIGTFFKVDGTITNDIAQNEADTDEEKAALSFGSIKDGILQSQSINSVSQMQATDKDGNLLFYSTQEAQTNKNLLDTTTDDTGFPVFYQAATADNLTAGSAAWVNGTLIKGNGSDNQAFLEQGYRQGYSEGVAEALSKVNVSYIYHTHNGTSSAYGGCYTTPVYHSHSDDCYSFCDCYNKGHQVRAEVGTNGYTYYYCYTCGPNGEHGCGRVILSCEQSAATGYTLGCGKTTDTIESATITF